eukprot:16432047-Heterocapsa_arctica.AAC.1
MDTEGLTRYLTINAHVKHKTGFSPATLAGKVQTVGSRERGRRAKTKLANKPVVVDPNKASQEPRKQLLTNLHRFKVFLPLPIAIDLNNLLAYKGKGAYVGKKRLDTFMKYKENEDLINANHFLARTGHGFGLPHRTQKIGQQTG